MSFTLNDDFLSALAPARFAYNSSNDTKFKGNFKPIKNNFYYFHHESFENFKDAALSKKSCLVLTDIKPLDTVFNSRFTSDVISLGKLSGSFYLKSNNKFLTTTSNRVYRGSPCGGEQQPILLTISPIDETHVNIRVGTKFIEIDQDYPFTVKLVDSQTFGEARYREFEVDYSDKKIAFKVSTKEGYRFLSFGIDNVMRAVGLELNDTIVNSYHFDVVSQTRSAIERGIVLANAEAKEIKYYNSFKDQTYNETLDIEQTTERYTNFIISCPTSKIDTSSISFANVAMLKTNYSPNGTFLPDDNI